MPTYQYQCPACDHTFEEFQSMSDKAISVCPACKGKTQRVISGGAGFIFKGSGFYITDYRSKAYKADAAKDKPSGASGASRASEASGSSGDKSTTGSKGSSSGSGSSGSAGKSSSSSSKTATSGSSGSSGASGDSSS